MQPSLAKLISLALLVVSPVAAFPRMDAETIKIWERAACKDGHQTPRKFVQPKPLKDGNTLKRIPGMRRLIHSLRKFTTPQMLTILSLRPSRVGFAVHAQPQTHWQTTAMSTERES